ncbi:ABC transporter permease [Helicobacter heilmannii]|uniref:ABC transporter permease n=1 Tax=Helicobacter heilmannii TaxID=35817 RepID=UPI0006A086CA|nr:ABC transporter permease [Helicobacter heilmannii]GMB94564.1 Antibiotic transport system permease [Helicobacter heilmannii]CRF46267.1 ABC-type multidrug transport system, permease component [Helicobacter heilmannii]CRF47203.1 ABC-type multidrug transport system, permease component [Helicobacter heilmannii]CRF49489.1 ABC-type multidrug transport system, permease component [Helicobacter heilmannii]
MFRAIAVEFRQIFSHLGVLVVVIGGPLFYAFLYPLPYKNDIVTAQKIALVDQDHSRLSRQLTKMLEASQEVKIASYPSSMQEAKKLLEEEKIFGIVLIPRFFERHVYTSVPAKIELYANANYFLIYSTIGHATAKTVQALSQKLKIYKDLYLGEHATEHNLFDLQDIPLYNPSLGYLNYAIAHVFIFILHQTLLIGAGGITCANPRRFQGFVEALQTCLVRALCFTLIYTFHLLLYFGVLFPYYGVHIHAHPTELLLCGLVFLFAVSSFGVLMGAFASKPAHITQIVLVASLPLVFMMGFIWPSELMPAFLRLPLQLIPATHGISALVMLNQFAAPISAVLYDLCALVVLAVGSLLIGAWRMQRRDFATMRSQTKSKEV